MKTVIIFIWMALQLPVMGWAQSGKPSMAILNADVEGLVDPSSIIFMIQLEAEKTDRFEILDKYEVRELLRESGITPEQCFSRTCLTSAGKALSVDKVLSGSLETFGQKIIVTLRIIDVASGRIEKTSAMEYLDLDDELQRMIAISVRDVFGLENDPNEVNLLVNYDTPISSPKTSLKLSGPRMGASIIVGDAAERLQASKAEGGYEMFPVISQFGYQWETQYLSAGNFQALIEMIGMVGGLESGKFIPSLAFLNGFRSSSTGWEVAFGPVFKLSKTARGYYDEEHKWRLGYEWDGDDGNGGYIENPYPTIELPDSRGGASVSTNLLIAIGKTFKSGYLNIPVNVYVIPNKKGSVIGTSFGFNIDNKARRK